MAKLGRPNRIRQLGIGNTIMSYHRAGLTHGQIRDKIKRDRGITIHRAMIGRWINSHDDNKPQEEHIQDDYFEKFRTFYMKFNEHMCTNCREWIAIACMTDEDIDEFRYEVEEAKRNHTVNNILRNKVDKIEKLHNIRI